MEIVLPEVCPEFECSTKGLRILEPGAGGGAFVDPLRLKYPNSTIHAVDINTSVGPWEAADLSVHIDFLHDDPPLSHYDLIAGNPPYTYALDFVKVGLVHAMYVVYLLRQGFMSSEERAAFFRLSKPSHVFLLSHRPSFTLDGRTDSEDYAFICWARGYRGPTKLDWLPTVPLEERRLQAKFVKGYNPAGDPRIVKSHRLFE